MNALTVLIIVWLMVMSAVEFMECRTGTITGKPNDKGS